MQVSASYVSWVLAKIMVFLLLGEIRTETHLGHWFWVIVIMVCLKIWADFDEFIYTLSLLLADEISGQSWHLSTAILDEGDNGLTLCEWLS
jgi:hypothetical protein